MSGIGGFIAVPIWRRQRVTWIVVVGYFVVVAGKPHPDGVRCSDAFVQQLAVVQLQANQGEDGQHEAGENDDVTQSSHGFHQRSDDYLETCVTDRQTERLQ